MQFEVPELLLGDQVVGLWLIGQEAVLHRPADGAIANHRPPTGEVLAIEQRYRLSRAPRAIVAVLDHRGAPSEPLHGGIVQSFDRKGSVKLVLHETRPPDAFHRLLFP